MFDRPGGPRPVELTPLGKVVLGHARDIIARVDATGEAVERFLAGAVGRIDIGTFQSVSNVLLPAIVQQLRREHPDVDIRLFEEEDNDAGAQAVLVRRARPRRSRSAHRGGDLESLLLLDDPFVLVAPAGELPDGPYPTVAPRTDASLVGYPPSSCQADIEDGLRACGADPTFVFRTYDNGAQMAMVRAGMGWAVMPLLGRRHARPGARRPHADAGRAAAPDLPRVAQGPHAVAGRRPAWSTSPARSPTTSASSRLRPDVRFVVYGPGAVGGVVGGRMFQHGHDVVLVARGAHREAIAERGLTVEWPEGSVTLPVPVVGSPVRADVRARRRRDRRRQEPGHRRRRSRPWPACAPPDTPIVCLQNGVANEVAVPAPVRRPCTA